MYDEERALAVSVSRKKCLGWKVVRYDFEQRAWVDVVQGEAKGWYDVVKLYEVKNGAYGIKHQAENGEYFENPSLVFQLEGGRGYTFVCSVGPLGARPLAP